MFFSPTISKSKKVEIPIGTSNNFNVNVNVNLPENIFTTLGKQNPNDPLYSTRKDHLNDREHREAFMMPNTNKIEFSVPKHLNSPQSAKILPLVNHEKLVTGQGSWGNRSSWKSTKVLG